MAKPSRTLLLPLLALVSGLSGGCSSCSGTSQRSLGVIEGPINDPGNRSLRRSIMAFGLSSFCQELTSRNAPLKLNEDSPIIGRFYPTGCSKRETEDGNVFVTFGGKGYAWTNLTKKITFSTSGAVEYNQDFLMEGSVMYAYFRTKNLTSSDFRTLVIEQPVTNVVNQIAPMSDNFGRQLLNNQLSQGFTVIREPNGTADFGVGTIELGQRPFHPYEVRGENRITYENLRTEIHQNQRDFIGPIVVEESNMALFMTASVDGGIPVDVLFLPKHEADASLQAYLDQPMTAPLAGVPFVADVIQPGVEFKKIVPVPKGTYFVVLDNTPTAGQVAPPQNPLDDRAAVISYVVQIGRTP